MIIDIVDIYADGMIVTVDTGYLVIKKRRAGDMGVVYEISQHGDMLGREDDLLELLRNLAAGRYSA